MLLSPIFLALGRGRVGGPQHPAAGSASRRWRRWSTTSPSSAAPSLLGAALGIDALAIGVVVGSFLHLAIQVPLLRDAFDYHAAHRPAATRRPARRSG